MTSTEKHKIMPDLHLVMSIMEVFVGKNYTFIIILEQSFHNMAYAKPFIDTL